MRGLEQCADMQKRGCRGCPYKPYDGSCQSELAKAALKRIQKLERDDGRSGGITLSARDRNLLEWVIAVCDRPRDARLDAANIRLSYDDGFLFARILKEVLDRARVIEHDDSRTTRDDCDPHFTRLARSIENGSRIAVDDWDCRPAPETAVESIERLRPRREAPEPAYVRVSSRSSPNEESARAVEFRRTLDLSEMPTAAEEISRQIERERQQAIDRVVRERLETLREAGSENLWESVLPLSGEGQVRSVREAEEGTSDRPRPEQTNEHVGGTE